MTHVSKLIITISALTLLMLFVSIYKSRAETKGIEALSVQGRERTIKKITEFNPPVKIKAVKTKGRVVPLDEAFIDEDDWLNGFAVLVRNDSKKAVTHLGVRLTFRPVGGGIPAARMLYHGPDPFFSKNGDVTPDPAVPRVLPGGELELKLSDAELESLKSFLKKLGFPDRIHVVEVRVYQIGFDDGTAWFGKMLKRGSGSVKWKRVDTPDRRL